MKMFRFQDFEIWKLAVEIGVELCRLADRLEKQRKYKFAEQLRDAALSISNNIAEGSGSTSSADFGRFLNIARRSAFEDANMLMFFHAEGCLAEAEIQPLLEKLHSVCRMIEGFRKSVVGA